MPDENGTRTPEEIISDFEERMKERQEKEAAISMAESNRQAYLRRLKLNSQARDIVR